MRPLVGGLVRLSAVTVALVVGCPVLAAPAQAVDCAQLSGVLTHSGADRTEGLLRLPAGLAGRTLPATAVTVSQDGLPVPVLAVRRVAPSLVDVALVVDTSARSAAARAAEVQAVDALTAGLPAAVSVSLVTAGGAPAVARALAPHPREAVAALAKVRPEGPARLVDAVSLAVLRLPTDPSRQQQVVVVGTGPDQVSAAAWRDVAAGLGRRGVGLDVLDMTGQRSLPAAGPQCPDGSSGAHPREAAAQVATGIVGRLRVVLPPTAPAQPLLVTLSAGGRTVTAAMQRRGTAAAAGVAVHSSPVQPAGARVLLLAIGGGLAVVLGALAVALLGTRRGRAVRVGVARVVVAARQLRGERAVPDAERRVPRAEGARRLADAWQDLNAAFGFAPTARELAEIEARAEAEVRAEELERRVAAAERAAGRDRAIERRERAVQRARELMAVERASRERARLSREATDLEELGAGVARPDDVLAVSLSKMDAATTRRAEAEWAAAEALLRMREEEEAAVLAAQARREAEAAAAAARSVAQREQRSAGKASAARRRSEATAARAAERARRERAAVEAARARRQAAEAQAKVAQDAHARALEEAERAPDRTVIDLRGTRATTDDRSDRARPPAAKEAEAHALTDGSTRRVSVTLPLPDAPAPVDVEVAEPAEVSVDAPGEAAAEAPGEAQEVRPAPSGVRALLRHRLVRWSPLLVAVALVGRPVVHAAGLPLSGADVRIALPAVVALVGLVALVGPQPRWSRRPVTSSGGEVQDHQNVYVMLRRSETAQGLAPGAQGAVPWVAPVLVVVGLLALLLM